MRVRRAPAPSWVDTDEDARSVSGYELIAQIGVHLGIIGAASWAIGSGLLTEEIEGDDEDQVDDRLRDAARTR